MTAAGATTEHCKPAGGGTPWQQRSSRNPFVLIVVLIVLMVGRDGHSNDSILNLGKHSSTTPRQQASGGGGGHWTCSGP